MMQVIMVLLCVLTMREDPLSLRAEHYRIPKKQRSDRKWNVGCNLWFGKIPPLYIWSSCQCCHGSQASIVSKPLSKPLTRLQSMLLRMNTNQRHTFRWLTRFLVHLTKASDEEFEFVNFLALSLWKPAWCKEFNSSRCNNASIYGYHHERVARQQPWLPNILPCFEYRNELTGQDGIVLRG